MGLGPSVRAGTPMVRRATRQGLVGAERAFLFWNASPAASAIQAVRLDPGAPGGYPMVARSLDPLTGWAGAGPAGASKL